MQEISHPIDNRREYFRIPFEEKCFVSLRSLGSKTFGQIESYEAGIIDISVGGISFKVDRDFPVSEYMTWKIEFPLLGERLALIGNLVRKEIREDKFIFGMRFIFIEDKERQLVSSKVNHLQLKIRQKHKWAME